MFGFFLSLFFLVIFLSTATHLNTNVGRGHYEGRRSGLAGEPLISMEVWGREEYTITLNKMWRKRNVQIIYKNHKPI